MAPVEYICNDKSRELKEAGEARKAEDERDKVQGLTQSTLDLMMVSATPSALDFTVAGSSTSKSRACGYDDGGYDILSVDECIELLALKGLDRLYSNKKFSVETNYDRTRLLLIYRYFLLLRV